MEGETTRHLRSDEVLVAELVPTPSELVRADDGQNAEDITGGVAEGGMQLLGLEECLPADSPRFLCAHSGAREMAQILVYVVVFLRIAILVLLERFLAQERVAH